MNENVITRKVASALLLSLSLFAGGFLMTAAVAKSQPFPPPGEQGAPPHPRYEPGAGHPLLDVFDQNADGTISVDELENATTVLRTFDRDENGVLDRDELEIALPPPAHLNGMRDGSRPPPPPHPQHED
ncbi:hypothetical protein [Synoicihabitans lomoniglobus]|uniref:EF-hand domain-containing protein n=1 Tax=Synoicihabitans lomoniglobus TaxID=2909285 RepID=A0AAE9ZWD0_9BACT|nr:hypothetical protein [Opitutaceae bacterium LMO-M01]WED63728.1 hypothetical protein PXH66_15435 [Opitutaceae bacterium LMO-M01]